MSRFRTSEFAGFDCHGSGQSAAPGAVRWLSLAATPVFAAMAAWTAVCGGQQDMLCMSSHGAWPLNGMAAMYALMSLFHAPSWLILIINRRSQSAPALNGKSTLSTRMTF